MTKPSLPFEHQPVLLTEVLSALNIRSGLQYVDGTVGGAGHALAIWEAGPGAIHFTGFDQDAQALAVATKRLPAEVTLHHANYSAMAEFMAPGEVTGGVLLDLGVSSPQLDRAERGFSFRQAGPLDMRMDVSLDIETAADWLNTKGEAELAACFKAYGEERLARPIAKAIVLARQDMVFTTTTQLATLVAGIYHRYRIREDHHPATRVFQALRIAVNHELDHLQAVLDKLIPLLAPGARVAVISFHSLEDRIVKRWMVQASQACVCPPGFPICQCGHQSTLKRISYKPITASVEETKSNPRARSAKLRVAERI